MAAYRRVYDFMTHVTCRLTAKNRLQLGNPMRSAIEYGLPSLPTKWRSYGDHRLCGVTTRYVQGQCISAAGRTYSSCGRWLPHQWLSPGCERSCDQRTPRDDGEFSARRHCCPTARCNGMRVNQCGGIGGRDPPPVQSCKSMGNRGRDYPPPHSTVV